MRFKCETPSPPQAFGPRNIINDAVMKLMGIHGFHRLSGGQVFGLAGAWSLSGDCSGLPAPGPADDLQHLPPTSTKEESDPFIPLT